MQRIPENELHNIKNILVIGAIGIGNLLMFSGTLRHIRRFFSRAHITMIVLKEGFKTLYEHDPSVDDILVLGVDRVKSVRQKIAFLRKLRKTKYQLCITTFPANRLEYNLLAFASGARWRVAHRYALKKLRSMSFLQNIRMPIDTALHDLEQNLNLLGAFGTRPDIEDYKLYFNLPDDAYESAQQYSEKNNIADNLLIGMHPGSSVERGMILKRWSEDKFTELCTWLQETFNAQVLLFGGTEEESLCTSIASKAGNRPVVVTGLDFLNTSALIARCTVFVTNDSGLMHVAVSMGVQTIAIFGPTDPGRTAPYGSNHVVIRTGIECSPCWSIRNLGVGMVNCIHPENICLTQLPVEKVKQAIAAQLKTAVQK